MEQTVAERKEGRGCVEGAMRMLDAFGILCALRLRTPFEASDPTAELASPDSSEPGLRA